MVCSARWQRVFVHLVDLYGMGLEMERLAMAVISCVTANYYFGAGVPVALALKMFTTKIVVFSRLYCTIRCLQQR
jgi:hypothetical protein